MGLADAANCIAGDVSRQALPAASFAALFNLAVHSVIGHKEYRFIELTSASLVLLAAIGSVNAWQWVEQRRGRAFSAPIALTALLAAWAGSSAWLGSGKPLDRWFGKSSHGPELVYLAGRTRRVCGLATMKAEFWQFSSRISGRPMPIMLLDNTPRPFPRLKPPGPELASVNAVIASSGAEAAVAGLFVFACKGASAYRRCLLSRPGPAVRPPRPETGKSRRSSKTSICRPVANPASLLAR